jgi:hypothetical protein
MPAVRTPPRLIPLAGALALAAGAASCSSSGSAPRSTATTPGRSAVTTSTAAPTPGPGGSTTTTAAAPRSATTSTTNPAAATTGGAIVITSPHAGQTVVSPMVVTGRSTVATVTVQLSDAGGNELASAVVRPAGGRFSVTMRFATASPGAGTLTAFDTGPGGARQDIATVPVQLSD